MVAIFTDVRKYPQNIMSILSIILLVPVAVIALLLILAMFMKKTHYVRREITINAPVRKVFEFIKLLKNQDKFNKWARTDPDRNWTYKGTDGTKGFMIAWSGNKSAGEGEKEIMELIENKRVATQIRFVRPMKISADVIMETRSLSPDETSLALINTGTMPYPMNLFIPMAEKKYPADMDESLQLLKKILEQPVPGI